MAGESAKEIDAAARRLSDIYSQLAAVEVPDCVKVLLSADLERAKGILKDRILALDPGAEIDS